MKTAFTALLAGVFFGSCASDESVNAISYELLPVKEVVVSEPNSNDRAVTVQLKYERPTLCHEFHRFYKQTDQNTTVVAIESSVIDYNEKKCPLLNNMPSAFATFTFKPDNVGKYTLRFWSGKNSDGQDIYLTRQITITE